MADTIFDKIIKKEIPADIIYETDEVLAFNDISPQAPFHCLIIPKKAIATINDIQPEDAQLIGQLYLAAAEIAKQQGVAENGYRVVMNCNKDGGQSVYHIHLHMLAGKTLGWPPYSDKVKQI
ncbi:histidine triad nucleotide-binding protein [Gayadomonas joobiniege]|uniref:histidine triad nucleotide-binding protein n=1 Tax=Gayadomonas joobiniege TaxID=1234606 RepID=UPI00037537F9|nr:histidine triad nucleotide-binding protein [Gayadomonas joobiniege]